MHDNKPKDIDKAEQGVKKELKALLSREVELRDRLQAIAADIRSGLDPDSEERAMQLENREVLEEIERVTSIELTSVRRLIADAKAGRTQ